MSKKERFGVFMVGALVLASGFVCSPVFADGPVNISIVEKVSDGAGGYKDWEDITGALPGATYSVIPQVKNDGTVAATTWMCITESVEGVFEIDINEHWTFDGESLSDLTTGRCYKYNSALNVGEMTEPLFSEAALSSAIENEHQGATFNLHLEVFATEVSEDPDVPINPSGADIPNNPDTGVATDSGSLTVAEVVPYVLGVAAVVVLVIHLLRNLRSSK